MIYSTRIAYGLLSAFVFAALLATNLIANADQWVDFSDMLDLFEVDFTQMPTKSPKTISADETKTLVRSTDYQDFNQTGAYVVNVQIAQPNTTIHLEETVDGLKQFYSCKTSWTEKPVTTPGADKGIEADGTDCGSDNFRLAVRFFQKGQWIYQVLAVSKKDTDNKIPQHFLNSFKILDARK